MRSVRCNAIFFSTSYVCRASSPHLKFLASSATGCSYALRGAAWRGAARWWPAAGCAAVCGEVTGAGARGRERRAGEAKKDAGVAALRVRVHAA